MHSFLYDVYAYFIFFPKNLKVENQHSFTLQISGKNYARQKKLPGFV